MDRAAKKVVVHLPDGTTKDVGLQHKLFPKLVTRISHRIHTMLVGPAGSGKTHAIHSAADSVGRKFYAISVGQQTTKSDLLGYKDANGVYQRTPLRDAVEFGGVFLLDEADAGNANTLTILNAMLSNGFAAFPDGMIDVHPDFVCFLAMNTYGRGADRSYVGRNQLDAASTDRFALIDFDYDEALEKAISRNDDWTAYVQKVRKAVFDQKIKHVVSPRASMMGGTLLEAGEKWKDVENEVLWKGLDSDLRQKALSAM
jgi:MoxR-like ATPase